MDRTEYFKDYRAKNKHKIKKIRFKYKHKVELSTCEKIKESQHNKCPICGADLNSVSVCFDILKGKLISVLCTDCYNDVSLFRTPTDKLKPLLNYLKTNQ